MTWLEDVVAAIEQSKQAYPNKEMPAEQQQFFVHMAFRFCFTGSLNLNGVEHKDWSSARRELSNAIRQDTAADWLAESCSSQQAADEEPEDSDAEFLEEFPKFLQLFPTSGKEFWLISSRRCRWQDRSSFTPSCP